MKDTRSKSKLSKLVDKSKDKSMAKSSKKRDMPDKSIDKVKTMKSSKSKGKLSET